MIRLELVGCRFHTGFQQHIFEFQLCSIFIYTCKCLWLFEIGYLLLFITSVMRQVCFCKQMRLAIENHQFCIRKWVNSACVQWCIAGVARLFWSRAKFEKYFPSRAALFKIGHNICVAEKNLGFLRGSMNSFSLNLSTCTAFSKTKGCPRAAKISWRAALWPRLVYSNVFVMNLFCHKDSSILPHEIDKSALSCNFCFDSIRKNNGVFALSSLHGRKVPIYIIYIKNELLR